MCVNTDLLFKKGRERESKSKGSRCLLIFGLFCKFIKIHEELRYETLHHDVYTNARKLNGSGPELGPHKILEN